MIDTQEKASQIITRYGFISRKNSSFYYNPAISKLITVNDIGTRAFPFEKCFVSFYRDDSNINESKYYTLEKYIGISKGRADLYLLAEKFINKYDNPNEKEDDENKCEITYQLIHKGRYTIVNVIFEYVPEVDSSLISIEVADYEDALRKIKMREGEQKRKQGELEKSF